MRAVEEILDEEKQQRLDQRGIVEVRVSLARDDGPVTAVESDGVAVAVDIKEYVLGEVPPPEIHVLVAGK